MTIILGALYLLGFLFTAAILFAGRRDLPETQAPRWALIFFAYAALWPLSWAWMLLWGRVRQGDPKAPDGERSPLWIDGCAVGGYQGGDADVNTSVMPRGGSVVESPPVPPLELSMFRGRLHRLPPSLLSPLPGGGVQVVKLGEERPRRPRRRLRAEADIR